MPRQKMLLRPRVTPLWVTLPNGQSFLARYERVSRKVLPRNVTIARTWQIGPRRQRKRKTQQGSILLGNIAKVGASTLTSTGLLEKGLVLVLGHWTLNLEKSWWTKGSNTCQNCINFEHQISKIKVWKKLLNWILLATQFRRHRKKPLRTCFVNKKMSKGISNSHGEGPERHWWSRHKWQYFGYFSPKPHEQVYWIQNNNFWKKGTYPFISANTKALIKMALSGGVFWTLNCRQTCSFFTLLGLMTWKAS